MKKSKAPDFQVVAKKNSPGFSEGNVYDAYISNKGCTLFVRNRFGYLSAQAYHKEGYAKDPVYHSLFKKATHPALIYESVLKRETQPV
ncbi:hypothetical protein ACFYKX_11585 [Cytobacillus sp. FJAT-54145]|uniref:KTSC domain-containing protein n=1 Tax=Cytobacillus spartinae TaxID=3299023 RepID=A0ABW6KEC0_9BACI